MGDSPTLAEGDASVGEVGSEWGCVRERDDMEDRGSGTPSRKAEVDGVLRKGGGALDCMYVCVCVCVCEGERKKESARASSDRSVLRACLTKSEVRSKSDARYTPPS